MTSDDTDERGPIPRAWREEFDGLRPIKPIAYKKPAPKANEADSEQPSPQRRKSSR